MNGLREQLAALAHEQWRGWMRYMFSKCVSNHDGSITIPAAYYRALFRQVNTDYADLTEQEQDSDREEADKVLQLLGFYDGE